MTTETQLELRARLMDCDKPTLVWMIRFGLVDTSPEAIERAESAARTEALAIDYKAARAEAERCRARADMAAAAAAHLCGLEVSSREDKALIGAAKLAANACLHASAAEDEALRQLSKAMEGFAHGAGGSVE